MSADSGEHILDRIVAYKREFVAECKRLVPIEELRDAVAAGPPPRGFARALRGTRAPDGAREPQKTLRVIAEIKKASPSKGVIRENFDPGDVALAYAGGGAAAISVLTDEKFFQGSLDNLRAARAVVDLPLLRKDFTIDPYQVWEARAAGADCILLIAGMIEWEAQAELAALASELGMDVLFETHDADELARVAATGASLIGVNNRDLRTRDFATDVRRTGELIAAVPPEATLVSESGIRDRADCEYLMGLGADAILVGEHLMREKDPGAAIAAKLGL